MKIRAAVLHDMTMDRPYDTTLPLKIEELELEPPGSNEVVVKIRAAGVCATLICQ